MKIRHIIGLFLIILMIGCSKQPAATPSAPTAPTPSTPATPQETAATPSTTTPAEAPAEPAEAKPASGGEVLVSKTGFDPETITIAKGSSLVWKNGDELSHIVIIVGEDTGPKMAKGEVFEHVFDKTGTYSVMDGIYKRKSTVIVK